MRSLLKYTLIVFLGLLALSAVVTGFRAPESAKVEDVPLSRLVRQINAGEVKSIGVSGDVVDIELKDAKRERAKKETGESLTQSLDNLGVNKDELARVELTVREESGFLYYAGALMPILLPFIILGLFFWLMFRNAQRGAMSAFNFGKTRAKLASTDATGKKKVTFKDVAGLVEAKEEVAEVVEFLRDPRRFHRLGARIPRGVLLVGTPGTGKTLLAKAVANEANVPFFSMSGSDFVEMFVGVGASRVRDTFEMAKKQGPSIIFIDELDAIGRHRGAGLGGGHDEREQTLNQILVELDGFETDDSVVVFAASVTGDTPVMVKKDGMIQLKPIQDVIDPYYALGEENVEKASPDIEVLGFEKKPVAKKLNERSYFGGSAFKKVRSVFRHKVTEIYEIDYLGGVVRATGNHSVFVRDRFGVKTKAVSSLKPGDKLVDVPYVVNRSDKAKRETRAHTFSADFSLTLPVYGPVFAGAEETKQVYAFAIAQRGLMSQSAIAGGFGLSQTVISHWQTGMNVPRPLSREYFKHVLPERVQVTPDFMRLLGYYTAEGYARKEVDFCFNVNETDLVHDLKELMCRFFGLMPDQEIVRGKAINIIYHSKLLAIFFATHCGKGAHYKHVPSMLFEAPKEYFVEFLRGYSLGDGYRDKRGRLEITSVSKQLIMELNWLSRMHGFKSFIRSFTAKEGRTINGGKPLRATEVWRLGFGASQNPFENNGKTASVKRAIVKAVRKVSYDGYVYDFCGCDNEAFFGGTTPLLLHNTNRPDILDPALLRPGRFDRRIILDEPSLKDREAILKIHATEKPLAPGVDFKVVAERTPGFSGADLANLLNEAAILAARKNQSQIMQTDILQAIEKVMLGPERRSRVLNKKEKEITAYHEAGHALVAVSVPHADPVHKVSIVSRGRAGGYTLKLPSEEKYLRSRSEFESELAVLLGGFTAEQIVFNELTTGASNDLKVASDLARRMVTEYGMSKKLGPVVFGDKDEMVFLGRDLAGHKNYSETVAYQIDAEVKGLIDRAMKKAKEIISKKMDLLNRIAQELVSKETLEQKEFYALLQG